MSAAASQHNSSRRLLGDALRVAKGTVIGQAPFILVTPLITRLCLPAELGIYGLALAFVGIAAPAVGLRLELAAISARNPDDARALWILSVLAVVPMTCLAMAVLCVLKLLDVGSYAALSWWMVAATGATIVAAGVYSTLRSWLVRRHRFGLVANSLTVQGFVRAGLPVLFAPLGLTALLLVASELLARLSAIWLMAYRGELRAALAGIHLRGHALRERARRFWKYPVLLGPSALIDAAATALPVPILASCYGLEVAGKFALVQRLVMLPAALIGSSVGDVFHAHAAEIAGRRSDSVGGFLAATAMRLLLLALVVYIPIALVAPFTARWIFGPKWADVGAMIAVLAPLCIAQTVVNPISRGLLLSGREERKLLADVTCVVLPLSTLYLARNQPALVAIAWFSAASVIAYFIYYLVILKALQKGPGHLVAPVDAPR
jgi:O-antigen/teichoic acid export membrane protein